jgi:hypothetical protein
MAIPHGFELKVILSKAGSKHSRDFAKDLKFLTPILSRSRRSRVSAGVLIRRAGKNTETPSGRPPLGREHQQERLNGSVGH